MFRLPRDSVRPAIAAISLACLVVQAGCGSDNCGDAYRRHLRLIPDSGLYKVESAKRVELNVADDPFAGSESMQILVDRDANQVTIVAQTAAETRTFVFSIK